MLEKKWCTSVVARVVSAEVLKGVCECTGCGWAGGRRENNVMIVLKTSNVTIQRESNQRKIGVFFLFWLFFERNCFLGVLALGCEIRRIQYYFYVGFQHNRAESGTVGEISSRCRCLRNPRICQLVLDCGCYCGELTHGTCGSVARLSFIFPHPLEEEIYIYIYIFTVTALVTRSI